MLSAANWMRVARAFSLAFLPATLGCDATVQALGAHSLSSPSSTHVGPLFEGRLHLPRRYDCVLGMEAGHLLQADPASVADQWRLGVIGGHSELAHPLGSRFSPEWTARIGLFRGSNGSGALVPAGLYGGFAFAVPIRISSTKEPWELDDLILTSWMLVPQLGVNARLPELRFMDTAVEITGSLGLRINLSSSVLP